MVLCFHAFLFNYFVNTQVDVVLDKKTSDFYLKNILREKLHYFLIKLFRFYKILSKKSKI